jgi:hypothetical protein
MENELDMSYCYTGELACPECGSRKIMNDIADGELVCMSCGYVLMFTHNLLFESTTNLYGVFVKDEVPRKFSVASFVKCPTCRTRIHATKSLIQWVLAPRKRPFKNQLGIRIYEHCGKRFRITRQILYYYVAKARFHEDSGEFHIFTSCGVSRSLLREIVLRIRLNRLPSFQAIEWNDLKKLREKYWIVTET